MRAFLELLLSKILCSTPTRLPASIPAAPVRPLSTTRQGNAKVCIVGASGGVGQPLALLLKRDPLVSQLSLYGMSKRIVGIRADLRLVDTPCLVKEAYSGPEKLGESMEQAQIVVVAAGLARQPGMTRDDLFKLNAIIISDVAEAIVRHCPKALVAIVTNPVNAVVPIAAEVFKKAKAFHPKRLFGVTLLDVVRARTFVADLLQIDPAGVRVNVICGHSAATIVPILSQCQPPLNVTHKRIVELTKRIQNAGADVVEAKLGTGSAQLATAYAAAKFINSLLRGLKGEEGVIECAYVNSKVTDAEYFASPLLLGKKGVCRNLGVPHINEYERKLLTAALPKLRENIKKGVQFVREKQ